MQQLQQTVDIHVGGYGGGLGSEGRGGGNGGRGGHVGQSPETTNCPFGCHPRWHCTNTSCY